MVEVTLPPPAAAAGGPVLGRVAVGAAGACVAVHVALLLAAGGAGEALAALGLVLLSLRCLGCGADLWAGGCARTWRAVLLLGAAGLALHATTALTLAHGSGGHAHGGGAGLAGLALMAGQTGLAGWALVRTAAPGPTG